MGKGVVECTKNLSHLLSKNTTIVSNNNFPSEVLGVICCKVMGQHIPRLNMVEQQFAKAFEVLWDPLSSISYISKMLNILLQRQIAFY